MGLHILDSKLVGKKSRRWGNLDEPINVSRAPSSLATTERPLGPNPKPSTPSSHNHLKHQFYPAIHFNTYVTIFPPGSRFSQPSPEGNGSCIVLVSCALSPPNFLLLLFFLALFLSLSHSSLSSLSFASSTWTQFSIPAANRFEVSLNPLEPRWRRSGCTPIHAFKYVIPVPASLAQVTVSQSQNPSQPLTKTRVTILAPSFISTR